MSGIKGHLLGYIGTLDFGPVLNYIYLIINHDIHDKHMSKYARF